MTSDPRAVTGFISGDRYRSTDELFERASRASRLFHDASVGPGDMIAIMLRNDFPFLEATYGAGALGVTAVPINWHYTADEAGYILTDCGAKALVIHADLLPQIGGIDTADLAIYVVATPPEVAAAYGIEPVSVPAEYTGWENAIAACEPWDKAPLPAPASVIYTSGTTGRPKGVQRRAPLDPTHPHVAAAIAALGVAPGMRTVINGPMYHSAPNTFSTVAGKTGGLVILQPRFDEVEQLRLIERYAVDALHVVPTMLVRMLRLPDEIKARYDISSLRQISHAAAPCPRDVKRAIIEWFGPVVHEYYGGTETGAAVACNTEEWLAHPGTVGKGLPGSGVRIYTEDGQIAPIGVPGDIYLKISEGYGGFDYLGKPEARREIERDGYVTVGDIGYLDEDGFLYLCDRRKDLIISGGVNIYPAEIEAVLVTAPGVKDCAVFGIPHPEFGESVAAVIEPSDPTITEEGVKDFLRGHMAAYKIPRQIEFAADLPREDSGKIFKRKLRDKFWPAGQAI